MAFLLLLGSLLAALAPQGSSGTCAGTACIVTAACGVPSNATEWMITNKTIDGIVATNLILAHPAEVHKPGVPLSPSTVNCPGADKGCHAWGAGFGDRNGVLFLDGDSSSFVVRSWPTRLTR